MIRKTTEQFIEDSIKIHSDSYNYDKVNYIDCKTQVIITCKIHGDFKQIPKNHLNGNGCSECGFKNRGKTNIKKTTEQFIDEAKQIFDYYDYSKTIYVNSKTRLTITCKTHGDFDRLPHDIISKKNGCQTCIKEQRVESQTKSQEQFIKEAIKIHGNRYNYEKVNYVNSTTKVEIICKIHGSFFIVPPSHLNNSSGCKKCAGNMKKTTEEFIQEAQKIHGIKYNYSKVNYIDSKTKILILCETHGKFYQTPSDHLSKKGCEKCGVIRRSNSQKISLNEFIKRGNEIHKNKYDYSKVKYVTANTKVIIICSKHGDFEQTPSKHLYSKQGCPSCCKCPSCQLWRTNGRLCIYCKPSNKNKLFQKTKEMDVVNYLKNKLPDNEFIHNRSVGTECTGGHFFPDIRFDCLWFQLIIEVDENKHRGASYECDEKRMYDITAKLGQPCIFLRYNPDSKDSNKEKLLEKINKYLDYENKYDQDKNSYKQLKINDLLGFKTEHLFY